MRIVLLGPPGAGKGTQAKSIFDKFGIPHISTGDIFRKNINDKTTLGIKAKEYIDKGQLVPDDVTVAIVEERISQNDCLEGFMLDGFPRTVNQADALKNVLQKLSLKLDYVLDIDVPNKALINRLTGRRVCTLCGDSYHVTYNPPKKDEICDACGGSLIQRDDDSVDTVTNRLEVYSKKTAPLIEYYRKCGLLYQIDGQQDMKKVFMDICDILGSGKK